MLLSGCCVFFFFFNDTATTEIYTLSLHDALPIYLAALDGAVRRLDEAQVVHPRVAGEARNEPDVRAFRRLDRAHAAVLAVVHVAHLEARALAREAARPEGGEAALVRQLREWVRLIHELRQLRAAEERLNDGAHRPRVHEVIQRDPFGIVVDAHPLLDEPRHARETDRELVRDQLAHRAHPAVAEVVDVVGVAAPLPQLDQVADDRDEVVLREDRVVLGDVHLEALVDLVAPHPAQVVALGVEEEPLQRLPRGLEVRRFTRPQQRVDLLQRLRLGVGRVLEQRVLDEWRLAPPRRQQHVDFRHARLQQLLLKCVRELPPPFGDDLSRLGVGDVERQDVRALPLARRRRLRLVAQVERRVPREHRDLADAGAPDRVELLQGELVADLAERLTLLVLGIRDVRRQQGAQHLALLGTALELARDVDVLRGVEQLQDVGVRAIAEGAEQRRRRELLLLVDVDVNHVVDVDRELDPRAPERNDPRREQPLAVRVDALFEHHAGGAVQLRHDHALGAVDDERAERREDRQLPEVDFLLDDVLGSFGLGGLTDLFHDHQLQRRLERDGVGHIPLDALLDRDMTYSVPLKATLQLVVM